MCHSIACLLTIWVLSPFSSIPLGISNTTSLPVFVAHFRAPQHADTLELKCPGFPTLN